MTDAGPSPGATRETPTASSLATRLSRVFFAPAALFDELRARPVWVDTAAFVAALTIVSGLLTPEAAIREMLESRVGAGADPEQLEVMVGRLAWLFRYGAIVNLVIAVAVVWGFLTVVYNFLLGGEATRRQLLSATIHSFVILGAGGALQAGLQRVRDGLVSLSLDLLVPGVEGYAFRLLQNLNFFALWGAVVLGIAVGRLYPKRSTFAAVTLLVGISVAWAALTAIPGG